MLMKSSHIFWKRRNNTWKLSNFWYALITDCYRSTLRALCNYKIVLDEIEDDIIDDTLERVRQIRSIRKAVYVSKGCHLEHKTRSEKAVTFMQYVLYNEDVLEEFQKVFSFRSEANLKHHKCQRCAIGNTKAFLINVIYIYYMIPVFFNDTIITWFKPPWDSTNRLNSPTCVLYTIKGTSCSIHLQYNHIYHVLFSSHIALVWHTKDSIFGWHLDIDEYLLVNAFRICHIPSSYSLLILIYLLHCINISICHKLLSSGKMTFYSAVCEL